MLRPLKGHSIHLGGDWFLQSSPDTGRVYYAKDVGPRHAEMPVSCVPDEALRAAGDDAELARRAGTVGLRRVREEL